MNELFNTGLSTVSIANANELEPDDVFILGSTQGYDKIPVFQLTGRISPHLTIVNFGPGSLHVRYSLDGRRFSEKELYLPDPTKQDFIVAILDKIYELRLRSPNANCQFQIFEGYYR